MTNKKDKRTESPKKDTEIRWCPKCEANRRREIALMNAELIIEEAKKRDAC